MYRAAGLVSAASPGLTGGRGIPTPEYTTRLAEKQGTTGGGG